MRLDVAATTRDQLVGDMLDRYVDVQYACVRFLSEHLTDCSNVFDGDLALVMIMAVVGQAHLSAFMAQDGDSASPLSYGMTSLRIADVTGLPGETARRKVKRLAARGWIESSRNGWAPTAAGDETVARRALADLDRRGIERLARLHADPGRILASPKNKKASVRITQNG